MGKQNSFVYSLTWRMPQNQFFKSLGLEKILGWWTNLRISAEAEICAIIFLSFQKLKIIEMFPKSVFNVHGVHKVSSNAYVNSILVPALGLYPVSLFFLPFPIPAFIWWRPVLRRGSFAYLMQDKEKSFPNNPSIFFPKTLLPSIVFLSHWATNEHCI
jgi:hypothetical protein